MYPDNLRYTDNHAWVRVENGDAVVGITHYAQDQLGEVVYIDLPQVGDDVTAGEVMGSVESVKSISDLYAPISGTVTEVNEALLDEPSTLNADPYGDGWLVKIAMSAPSEVEGLSTAAEYTAKLG